MLSVFLCHSDSARLFCVFLRALSLCGSGVIVSTSKRDCAERLVFEMACNVLMWTLNPTALEISSHELVVLFTVRIFG